MNRINLPLSADFGPNTLKNTGLLNFREYPCDHVAMLNLAVLNVGNPRVSTHETALQLLHLLDTRFFQEEPIFTDNMDHQQKFPLNDILLSVSYCHSQMYLSEQLARIHPDLTMPMFSGNYRSHHAHVLR